MVVAHRPLAQALLTQPRTPKPLRPPAILSSSPLFFPCAAARTFLYRITLSFPCLFEVSQVRWRLILLGGHQVAVRAHHVNLLPNADMFVALGTNGLDPNRMADAMVALDDRPRAGQRIVNGCDFVLEDVCIALVEIDSFLDDRLIVGM